MKPLSPRQRLAQALDAIGGIERYAVLSGVSPRDFANAQSGRQVATVPFLRICVAVRHDPLHELPHKMPEIPSNFDFCLLALAFYVKRNLNGQTEAQTARALGVELETICRMERGERMPIGVVLRACKFVNVHPFGYLAVLDTPSISKKIDTPAIFLKTSHVSRETSVGG